MSMAGRNPDTMASSTPEVRFLLSGRTTLSEHLPSEFVDVPLQILARSRHLHQLVAGRPSNATIKLGDIDPAGFKVYITWLRVRHGDRSQQSHSNAKSLLLRECIDLIYAHIVGGQLREPYFQDYIIDEIERTIGPAQSPDNEVLDILFIETATSDMLRNFIINKMFAWERRMVAMVKGVVGSGREKTLKETRCQWHIHDEDGRCYLDLPFTNLPEIQIHDHDNIPHTRPSSPLSTSTIMFAPDAYFDSSTTSRYPANNRGVIEANKPLPDTPGPNSAHTRNLRVRPFGPSRHTFDPGDPHSIEGLTKMCLERNAPQKSNDIHELVDQCLGRISRQGDLPPIAPSMESPPDLSTAEHRSVQFAREVISSTDSDYSLSEVSLPQPCRKGSFVDLPPLVKRRPAPPRGDDWVEQWDRLYALQGTQGFGLRKAEKYEKKSRFRDFFERMK
jgi:hypothetical protein